MNIKEAFSNCRVAIVGDIMLDQYWWGTVDRISPEAPVPVVTLESMSTAPGGAANVAANIAGLGARPILVGCVGRDRESEALSDHLASLGISSDHLVRMPDRPTAVKTRVVAHGQHVVRVDRETTAALAGPNEADLVEILSAAIDSAQIVIVSDYAKGTITPSVLGKLFDQAKRKSVRVLVDPKGKEYSKYRGASILTPNRREAADASGLDDKLPDLVRKAGGRLLSELDLFAIVVTEGEHGMTLLERDKEPVSFHAQAREIFDVTGAGDTVIACLGVALAAGISLVEAVRLANLAASLVVEQVGTTAITIDRLMEATSRPGRQGAAGTVTQA